MSQRRWRYLRKLYTGRELEQHLGCTCRAYTRKYRKGEHLKCDVRIVERYKPRVEFPMR